MFFLTVLIPIFSMPDTFQRGQSFTLPLAFCIASEHIVLRGQMMNSHYSEMFPIRRNFRTQAFKMSNDFRKFFPNLKSRSTCSGQTHWPNWLFRFQKSAQSFRTRIHDFRSFFVPKTFAAATVLRANGGAMAATPGDNKGSPTTASMQDAAAVSAASELDVYEIRQDGSGRRRLVWDPTVRELRAIGYEGQAVAGAGLGQKTAAAAAAAAQGVPGALSRVVTKVGRERAIIH